MALSYNEQDWQDFQLQCGRGLLAGKSLGSGTHLLLCLHGYGNNRHLFDGILPKFPDSYTLISIELPYFGESIWQSESPLTQVDLCEIWDQISRRFPHTERNLLCYSLGAKFGMGLIQADSTMLSRVILIAPDGLLLHPMYKFCMYHPIGHRLFRWVVKSPRFFLFVLRTLYNLKIADAFKYRFVKTQFESEENRRLLHRVWFGFSNIRPDVAQLAQIPGVQWHLVWGEKDNILPPKIGKEFASKVPGTQLHLMDAGHLILKNKQREIQSLLCRIFTS